MTAATCVSPTAVVLLLVALAGNLHVAQCARLSGGVDHSLQQAAKAEWVVVLSTDVATHDIPCSSSTSTSTSTSSTNKPAALAKERGSGSSSSSKASSCRVCGGAHEVSAACVANPSCVAFVMSSQAPGCGTLKGSTSGQAGSSDHTLFCNKARGAKCTGQFSFTPRHGMMFTGDYKCSSSSSGSTLCFTPGDVNSVAAACLQDGKCRAVAYNRADQGGYFKDSRGVASPTPGSDLYQRL